MADTIFRLCTCAAIPILLIIGVSLYAFRINAKKAPNDPSKKDYSPYAPWLTPISLPFLLIINVIFFVLSSLVFGIFLVLFPFSLILFRGPFLFKWISKQALKIGNFILKVNTELLRVTGFHPISTGPSI